MKVVRYFEPNENDEVKMISIGILEAIKKQKISATSSVPTFRYKSDEDALEDFMTVNYAWFVEE